MTVEIHFCILFFTEASTSISSAEFMGYADTPG